MSGPGASIRHGATVLRREGQHTGKKTWRHIIGVALPTHHREPKGRKRKWSRWQIGSRWGDGGVVAGSTETVTRCRFSRRRHSFLLWLLERGRYSSAHALVCSSSWTRSPLNYCLICIFLNSNITHLTPNKIREKSNSLILP
jgi:hypothetical protein